MCRSRGCDQVHGDVVHVVDSPPDGPTDEVPVADALVTTRRGVGLMVRVADCVPVLLADPVAGVVGAVHAGRLGVTLDVVSRAVERMRALGAEQVRAWIGPHVCGRCYEVPEAMRSEVAAVVPATMSETSWGTPALDLGAGVAAQLAAAGVPVDERRPVHARGRAPPLLPARWQRCRTVRRVGVDRDRMPIASRHTRASAPRVLRSRPLGPVMSTTSQAVPRRGRTAEMTRRRQQP